MTTLRLSTIAPLLLTSGFILATACGDDDAGRTAETTREREASSAAPGFAPLRDSALNARAAATAEWPVYGGSYNNQRYSALTQIDRDNVAELTPAWVYQTGVSGAFETTPIVADNAMYLTTAESHVIALNAATGEELWHFVPELETALLCCGPINRGVAVYEDKVYVGTLDARLIALERRDGSVAWETRVADPEDGYSITMAPLAYDGRIVVGVGGGEYGIRGFVAAYDAETGERSWRFHTIPAPGDAPNGWWGEWKETTPFGTQLNRDIIQERQDSAQNADAWERGGGGVWMTPAYEPGTGTLFVVVGNPAPDLAGTVRPGDNLYTGSIIALDGESGELRWHFQYLPHDRWNLSGGSTPLLFREGDRRYVAHAGKTGWLYVVDAATGAPVIRSQNFVPQQNLFATPSSEGTPMAPGTYGGSGSSPLAFSPRTGLAYVLAQHQPMAYTRAYTPYREGLPWLGGRIAYLPDEERWGTLSAIDVGTGRIDWQRRVPVPMVGGALVTAGGVLFAGQGSGTFDAFDAQTGELLWQFRAGAGVHGGPITYSIGGTQYVAVAAGGNHQLDTSMGDGLYAFALGNRRHTRQVRGYESASYHRSRPQRYGAVRQVPRERVQEDQRGRQPPRD